MIASSSEGRKEFGSRLRAARLSLGYTQEQMAYATGINLARYSKYEIGRSEPPHRILCRIADVADADLNYLITGEKRENLGDAGAPTDRLLDLLPSMPTMAVVYDRQRRLMAHNEMWRDRFFPDRPKGLLRRGTPQEVLIRAWAHAHGLNEKKIEAFVQARLDAAPTMELLIGSNRFHFVEAVDSKKRLVMITDLSDAQRIVI